MFAIADETAIAKGVRRIEALTRDQAAVAIDNGDSQRVVCLFAETALHVGRRLTERIASLETQYAQLNHKAELQEISSAESVVTLFRTDCDAILTSAPVRYSLRARAEALQKQIVVLKKSKTQQLIDQGKRGTFMLRSVA
jgi:alanyl-tRNA synthetase